MLLIIAAQPNQALIPLQFGEQSGVISKDDKTKLELNYFLSFNTKKPSIKGKFNRNNYGTGFPLFLPTCASTIYSELDLVLVTGCFKTFDTPFFLNVFFLSDFCKCLLLTPHEFSKCLLLDTPWQSYFQCRLFTQEKV